MSNLYLIISNAYNKNIFQECQDGASSTKNIFTTWSAAEERDIAKMFSVVFKALGTVTLVFFGLSAMNILKKRTASVGRIFFSTFYFFATAELLKASHNLRFEYSMTSKQKAQYMKAEEDRWYSVPKAVVKHGLSTVKKLFQKQGEEFLIENPDQLEGVRLLRVTAVAVKDTYLLGPLFNFVTQQLVNQEDD